MPTLPDSSIDCLPCRLEWRPSRIGAWAGAVLVSLAGAALLMTRWVDAWPLVGQGAVALAAMIFAVFAYRRELRRPHAVLELLPEGTARWTSAREEGAASAAIEAPARLHEQWPLTTVRLLPAGPTVVFWPDTLCDSGRRALRRWAGAAPDASPLSQFWMG